MGWPDVCLATRTGLACGAGLHAQDKVRRLMSNRCEWALIFRVGSSKVILAHRGGSPLHFFERHILLDRLGDQGIDIFNREEW